MKIKNLLAICMASILILAMAGCSSAPKTNYYKNTDFISESDPVWETKSSNLCWGKYQKEYSEMGENALELHAGMINPSLTKEEFDDRVKQFKDKLDVLESDYAFAYTSDEGDVITVKMDDSRLGLPVFALLNASNNQIVSTMRDLSLFSLTNFTYSLGENGKFDLSVEIPEYSQDDFSEYIAGNSGTELYLKIGDLTFSSTTITEDMPSDKVSFNGLDFLGSSVKEKDYEFIMKLAEYTINNQQSGRFTMDFPTETNDEEGNPTEYKVPYVTPVDEAVIEQINALYDDVTFTRSGVYNSIRIKFNTKPHQESVESCLNKLYTIYDACNFDGGAYTYITFVWPSADSAAFNNYVTFTKKNGKMLCTGYSDRIETEVKLHPFFSSRLED